MCAGITNPFKFRECLRILKRIVMNKYFQSRLSPNNQLPANSASSTLSAGHADGRGGAATNGRAENDRGVVEVRGNAEILRLDDAQPLGERYWQKHFYYTGYDFCIKLSLLLKVL